MIETFLDLDHVIFYKVVLPYTNISNTYSRHTALHTFTSPYNCNYNINTVCSFFTDPPKNTSLLARPSSVVDAGRPLTLTCSSQANPAVDNFTWHRLALDGGSVQC